MNRIAGRDSGRNVKQRLLGQVICHMKVGAAQHDFFKVTIQESITGSLFVSWVSCRDGGVLVGNEIEDGGTIDRLE